MNVHTGCEFTNPSDGRRKGFGSPDTPGDFSRNHTVFLNVQAALPCWGHVKCQNTSTEHWGVLCSVGVRLPPTCACVFCSEKMVYTHETERFLNKSTQQDINQDRQTFIDGGFFSSDSGSSLIGKMNSFKLYRFFEYCRSFCIEETQNDFGVLLEESRARNIRVTIPFAREPL